ncbi:divalent metal cation transporter [Altererythrobacter sp. CC-YST694]|uniref:NRAMP family divalent metal transporter n=1 Tax=Altererythrobacter sp. CC-YST694 TaxID=2755038 RepID=UPI001D01A748|nr:divalent metal cation transporter [Altererythrobacter sp. CC-YST694]MCB5426570.1 divalent metal cation transporter [Altererythrobacter sp. CC-YST694]
MKPQEDDPSLLEVLGPGLVTGAADDDPSGIGTYSQVGAQFGYGMAWTMFFGFPLLAAIQAICARIGATTGRGIAQNLRHNYPLPLLQGAVLLLLLANVINLGADLGAMGAALALIVPGPVLAYTAAFGVLSVLLEVLLSYDRYARILKWTTLSLFAYVGVVFVVDVPLDQAIRGMLIPQFQFDKVHAMALVAVLGTTISPYLFFWQAGQEVEEQRRRHIKPLHVAPSQAGRELRRLSTDTLIGMGFSQVVALFIIIATAATLHANGVHDIESAAQAAEALRPIAGELTFALFAIGIIGTGLLAVPILAGSAAYALSEAFGWVEGLDRKPREAKAFYATIATATLGGVALNLLSIDPMRALYLAAVVNGLLAPPLMAVTMLIACNRKVMGPLAVRGWLAVAGWISTAAMTLVAGVFLFT